MANCPNKKRLRESKEIVTTISEAMVVEPSSNSWWVGSAATRHIARDKGLFVEIQEKQLGEHRVYMGIGKNTYSDELGEGKCKLCVNGSNVILSDVFNVPGTLFQFRF
jgi:hypothetical protein